ncbi:MAG: hypothetical protein ACI8QC_003183 [Planctomycetota bacterium]|jgi:hypothetical protein
MKALIVLTSSLLLASAAQANDDFDSGTNPNGWSFGVTTPDVVEPNGGNPGGYLHNPFVASFAPIVQNDENIPSAFTGDFRAAGVTRISVDAITNSVNFGNTGFEFSMVLRDTKGTPQFDDDDYAYYVGPEGPQEGNGWKSFIFDVPSQSTDAVPAGWKGGWAGDGENFRPGVEWSDIITNVDRVEFWWLNPSFFAIIQNWDVGIDNVTVETGLSIGPNYCGPAVVNSSGGPGSMSAFGSNVAADNNLMLRANGLPANQFGYFLGSMNQAFIVGPGGSQGDLCLGGTIARFTASIQNSGPLGVMQFQVDLTDIPLSPSVPVLAGETWNFQAWFRDANPSATSNFTDGLSVDFL